MSSSIGGEHQLKVSENQLKHILKRLFETIDIKGRGALDQEEFREMICFVKEDICSDFDHGFNVTDENQEEFQKIWN